MSYNNTVYCGYCYQKGHNQRGCPKKKQYAKDNPDSYVARDVKESAAASKNRRCGYCKEAAGHTRRTCAMYKSDFKLAEKVNVAYRAKVLELLKQYGIGIGALVKYEDTWRGNGTTMAIVTQIQWDQVDFRGFENSGTVRFIGVTPCSQLGHRYPDTEWVSPPEVPWYDGDDSAEGAAHRPMKALSMLNPVSVMAVEATVPEGWVDNTGKVADFYSGDHYQSPRDTAERVAKKMAESENKSE